MPDDQVVAQVQPDPLPPVQQQAPVVAPVKSTATLEDVVAFCKTLGFQS